MNAYNFASVEFPDADSPSPHPYFSPASSHTEAPPPHYRPPQLPHDTPLTSPHTTNNSHANAFANNQSPVTTIPHPTSSLLTSPTFWWWGFQPGQSQLVRSTSTPVLPVSPTPPGSPFSSTMVDGRPRAVSVNDSMMVGVGMGQDLSQGAAAGRWAHNPYAIQLPDVMSLNQTPSAANAPVHNTTEAASLNQNGCQVDATFEGRVQVDYTATWHQGPVPTGLEILNPGDFPALTTLTPDSSDTAILAAIHSLPFSGEENTTISRVTESVFHQGLHNPDSLFFWAHVLRLFYGTVLPRKQVFVRFEVLRIVSRLESATLLQADSEHHGNESASDASVGTIRNMRYSGLVLAGLLFVVKVLTPREIDRILDNLLRRTRYLHQLAEAQFSVECALALLSVIHSHLDSFNSSRCDEVLFALLQSAQALPVEMYQKVTEFICQREQTHAQMAAAATVPVDHPEE